MSLEVEGHAVRGVRVGPDDGDAPRRQVEALYVHARAVLPGHREGGEVEGILVGGVDGALVRVDLREPVQLQGEGGGCQGGWSGSYLPGLRTAVGRYAVS